MLVGVCHRDLSTSGCLGAARKVLLAWARIIMHLVERDGLGACRLGQHLLVFIVLVRNVQVCAGIGTVASWGTDEGAALYWG